MERRSQESCVLTGPPGSGKTRALLDLFRQAIRDGREADSFFIVPDSGAMEHMRDLIARTCRETPGLPTAFSDRGVHSLQSLVRKLGGIPSADVAHCRALISRWAGEGRIDAVRFRSLGTSGGQAALAQAVLTLRREGHTFESLSSLNEQTIPILSPLRTAMRLWEEWLRESGKRDAQDVLRSASEAAKNHKPHMVLVDGFTEIRPLHRSIVETLAAGAMRCAVAIDPDQYPARELLDRFLSLGFEERKTLSSGRWPERDELGWLADVDSWDIHGSRPSSCPESIPPNRLRIIRAGDERIEAAILAREVARCVREDLRYSDVVIISPNLGQFRKTLAAEFRRAGIPLRFYVDEPLIETGPGALIDAFLAVLSGDFSDETVVRLLTHPAIGFPPEESRKALVDTKTKYRLGSRDAWLDRSDGVTKGILLGIARLQDKPPVDATELAEKLAELAEERIRVGWSAIPDNLVAEEAWSWERVRSTLLESSRILDETQVGGTVPDIARFLGSELRDALARPLDRRRDCVNAVTLLGARTWGVPVAMVSGLSRVYFPPRRKLNPFLPDDLREILDPPLPTYEELQKREEALFRMAVTRASDRLILTWPETDSQGSPLLPSGPLERCMEWLCDAVRPAEVDNDPPFDVGDAVFPADIAAIALEEKIDDPALKITLSERAGHFPDDVVRSESYESIVTSGGDALVGAACGSLEAPITPTDLNALAQCPYRFFARRILRLSESQRDLVGEGFSEMQWGIIAHEALSQWFRGGKVGDFDELVRSAAAKRREIAPGSVSEARISQIVDALRRFERFDIEFIRKTGFEQKWSELVFGPERKRDQRERHDPVAFDIGNGLMLTLGGRIDRIDVNKDNDALILDYKRSRGVGEKKLKDARDLQLACYIALVTQGLGLDVAAAAFIPLIKVRTDGCGRVIYDPDRASALDPKAFRRDEKDDALEIERHLEVAKRRIGELVRAISSGDITPSPLDKTECGDKCPYRDLCRYEFTGEEGVTEDGESDAD